MTASRLQIQQAIPEFGHRSLNQYPLVRFTHLFARSEEAILGSTSEPLVRSSVPSAPRGSELKFIVEDLESVTKQVLFLPNR